LATSVSWHPGAWKENRTPNLQFTKLLLCRLSYPGTTDFYFIKNT